MRRSQKNIPAPETAQPGAMIYSVDTGGTVIAASNILTILGYVITTALGLPRALINSAAAKEIILTPDVNGDIFIIIGDAKLNYVRILHDQNIQVHLDLAGLTADTLAELTITRVMDGTATPHTWTFTNSAINGTIIWRTSGGGEPEWTTLPASNVQLISFRKSITDINAIIGSELGNFA